MLKLFLSDEFGVKVHALITAVSLRQKMFKTCHEIRSQFTNATATYVLLMGIPSLVYVTAVHFKCNLEDAFKRPNELKDR